MIVLRLQTGVRSHFVTRMPEWGLSAILMAFAIQLLRPSDSFHSSSGYALLSRHVSETGWGCFAATVAGAWLLALLINGSFKRTRRVTPWVRSICALAAAGFWTTNAAVILITIPSSPGVINNSGFAFFALAYSILTAREVGQIDGTAKKCSRPNLPKIG